MALPQRLPEARAAQLRALQAEVAGRWHVAVQQWLLCLDVAERAHDDGACRFFAARLGLAYERMGMAEKAAYYRMIAG